MCCTGETDAAAAAAPLRHPPPSPTFCPSLPLPFLPRFLPFWSCSASLGNGRAAALVVGYIRLFMSSCIMIRRLHPHTSFVMTFVVGVDEIENGKAWIRTLEDTVGEVVPLTERHEHVHAARSRTFRLAPEPSVRDKKKGRKTSSLKIHADSPTRCKRLSAT